MAHDNYGWGSDGYAVTNSGTNDQVRSVRTAPSKAADWHFGLSRATTTVTGTEEMALAGITTPTSECLSCHSISCSQALTSSPGMEATTIATQMDLHTIRAAKDIRRTLPRAGRSISRARRSRRMRAPMGTLLRLSLMDAWNAL